MTENTQHYAIIVSEYVRGRRVRCEIISNIVSYAPSYELIVACVMGDALLAGIKDLIFSLEAFSFQDARRVHSDVTQVARELKKRAPKTRVEYYLVKVSYFKGHPSFTPPMEKL